MENLSQIRAYASREAVPILQDETSEFICEYIKNHKVKTIFEIGTAIGYSSIKFASLFDDIQISTIEIEKSRYEKAIENITKCNLQNRIKVYLDDALTFDFPKNDLQKFDLIFIDAAKAQYIKFFEKYKKNLNENGVFISDNLSFHGMVQDPSLTHSYSTKKLIKKIQKYIDFLKQNSEFVTEFFDLGDGISVSKKK